MRGVTVAIFAAGSILLGAGAANAQAPDRRNFNFKVPGCPTTAAGLQTVNYDKFTDGTPLPMCSATVGTTRYAFVWTGYRWAVYGPATADVHPAPQPHTTPMPSLPALTSLQTAPLKGAQGVTLYHYNGKWYRPTGVTAPLNSAQAQKLITDNGGGIVSHDSGTLLSTNGGNVVQMRLIGSDSAGIVDPPPKMVVPEHGPLVALSSLTTGHRAGDGLTYYNYQGAWYTARVVPANAMAVSGGKVIARDDHGAYYELIAAGGGNIISSNSGGLQQKIIGPNGITINQGSNLR